MGARNSVANELSNTLICYSVMFSFNNLIYCNNYSMLWNFLWSFILIRYRLSKAGFILWTQIYGVYADHFAHLGRVFSATNADLRRRDLAGAEYNHSYNTPTWRRGCWIVIG